MQEAREQEGRSSFHTLAYVNACQHTYAGGKGAGGAKFIPNLSYDMWQEATHLAALHEVAVAAREKQRALAAGYHDTENTVAYGSLR